MKYLALGPAGMGLFSIIGKLKSIEERIDLFQEISGSSAGAIIALLLGIGLTIDEILDKTMSVDTHALTSSFSLKSMITMYGCIDPTNCKCILRDICGGDPTFRDLKKKIYISAYNLERTQTEYFSRDTHPDMSVIDAVYRSCSIPFIFASDNMYVDGGLCEKVPLTPFLDKKNEDVLVIEIVSTTENTIKNFMDFAVCLVRNCMMNRYDYPQFTNRCKIQILTSQIAEFTMSMDDKLSLYIKGFKENIIYL
tara:strand:+ start:746 stop:1501 length:756 start_codon:yes stop_codon:yes gene_type:complete